MFLDVPGGWASSLRYNKTITTFAKLGEMMSSKNAKTTANHTSLSEYKIAVIIPTTWPTGCNKTNTAMSVCVCAFVTCCNVKTCFNI